MCWNHYSSQETEPIPGTILKVTGKAWWESFVLIQAELLQSFLQSFCLKKKEADICRFTFLMEAVAPLLLRRVKSSSTQNLMRLLLCWTRFPAYHVFAQIIVSLHSWEGTVSFKPELSCKKGGPPHRSRQCKCSSDWTATPRWQKSEKYYWAVNPSLCRVAGPRVGL